MITLDSALEALRARNMRITPQRLAVVEELVGNTTHPTAEQMAKRVQGRMYGVSTSTIYKTLNELVEIGLVRKVDSSGKAHFDPEIELHGHLRCIRCGDLVDVSLPGEKLKVISEMEERNGVRVTSVAVQFEGICRSCSKGEKK